MSRTRAHRSFRFTLALAAVLLPMLAALSVWTPAAAVDHREAPLIMLDPVADITDTYSFITQPGATASPLGVLAMIPEPVDPATWGDTSMLLELGDDIPDPLSGPFTTSVQITQLGLRSSVPITVTNPDGTTEQWDVEIGPSPTVPSTGTLNVIPTVSGGGSFSIEIPLTMNVTYTRLGDGEVRTFDYATQPNGAVRLSASGPFSLSCPTNRLTIPNRTTPFCLGHDLTIGQVLALVFDDLDNPSNPRFSTRVEPTLAPVNNPPVLNPIGNMTMNEGGRLGRTFGASDPDGDSLTFSVDGLPDFVTFIDRGDGIAIFDSMPAVGDAGVYTITVTVTDNGTPPLSDSETFTLTVLGTNRPPVLNPIGLLEVREGESRTFIFVATDPDGDQLTLAIQNAPAYSQFIDSGNGTATFIVTPPDGSEFDSFEVTVTVTDDGAPPLSDQETFRLNIAPGFGNLPPVLDPIGDQTVREGEPTRLLGLVRATDGNRDTLSVSAVGLPTPCALVPNTAVPGVVVADLRCDADVQAGRYTVTVTVTDGFGGSDSETFTLTIQPFLDTGGDQTVAQGEQVQLNPTSSPGAVVELDLDNDGVFESPAPAIFDATGLAPGDYLVGVRAFRNGVYNTGSITVTVVQGNRPPVLTPIGDRTAKENGFTMSFISGSDPDGDLINVGAGGSLPNGCFLGEVFGSGPGSWLGVIQCDPEVKAGVYSPTVTAMDGRGGSDSETFTLTVLPVLDAGADRTVAQGTPVELTATSPNPNLTYSWDINSDGFFDDAFGADVLFPTAGLTPGTYPVTVQGCAPDSGAGSVCNTDAVDVTVRNAWTYDDLRRLTREYVDNPLLERGLVALVNLAEAFAGRGLQVFANGTLDLYIRTIQAATPRFVTAVEAQELLEIAGALKQ